MVETDGPPNLKQMKRDSEYTVYYRSQRSGNEVDRTGVVTQKGETDSGHLVRLHTDQRGCFKHQYVALVDTETNDGQDTVAAFSLTATADPPGGEDPPQIGRVYTLTFSTERSSYLGLVDRVLREDGAGMFLVTDGGSR